MKNHFVLIYHSLQTKTSVVGGIVRMTSSDPHSLILPSRVSVGGTCESDDKVRISIEPSLKITGLNGFS